jgi:serine/threonine protein kinase
MQLGRYEILEPIGLGASSTVFKARDTLIGRIVAIKTLQAGLNDNAWRERFMAEARIVGQLSHPRIVKLHDMGIDENSGAPYLVMEYVVGQTLEKYVAAKKPELQQVYSWGAALGRAVAYAHQQGIIHGDIKPANIMIDQNGRVMLTDFGIARFSAHITQLGGLRGTPAYLSPEQVEGKPTDGRSDIFSLGIVLYQLATGQRPFQGDSMEAVCAQILKAKITPATKVNRMLPRAFDDVVERCLGKKPEDRYADGEILSAELEAVAREPLAPAHAKPVENRSVTMSMRYAGAVAGLVLVLFVPIAARFYMHKFNFKLAFPPAVTFPPPKPPANLPLWRDMQEIEAASSEEAAPELPVRSLVQPKPTRTVSRRQLQANKPKPSVVEAASDPVSLADNPPKSADQPAAPAATAGIPMLIEISAQSSDGTVAVFADHQMIFSTPLASVAPGEQLHAVCKLIPGEHQLSVALYKADNSLRAEKQGLAELHHGDNNLLAIRVVKHSKILLLRGTGLEVTWPNGAGDTQSEHGPRKFSAQAAEAQP